jgi:predicted dehydrogenase
MKIGIIGLDTSHVSAFTKFLNGTEGEGTASNARVVVAFPGGSPDMAASRDRVAGFTTELRDTYDVSMVDSPEAVAEACDAILLCSVDGRVHRDQFSRVAGAGKPIFIDKPFASSVADAEAMADLAARNGARVFSSSALRFSTALTDVLDQEAAGAATGADFCGPMAIEPTSPGLFWYGVHTVEMLFTSLGTGCRSVVAASKDEHDCVIGVWEDGRLGTIRGNRTGNNDFQGLVHFAGRTAHVDIATARRPYFSSLLDEVMSFFKGGESPVPLETSVEIVRFMEAGNLSRESGEVVSLG